MNKAHLDFINKQYEEACEKILIAFCDTYEQPYYKGLMWVADRIGEDACVGDYYISLEEMRVMLNNNITWNEFLKWTDYNLTAMKLGLDTINLRSWIKGCPRLSDEQISHIQSLKQEIEEICIKYKHNPY